MSTENINDTAIAQFTGTTRYYRHFLPGVLLTDGAAWLTENGAAWLIDAIASWQVYENIRSEDFQHWKLEVQPDESAVLICDDGNGKELARQRLSWTDFPIETISLYAVYDGSHDAHVIMLVSEY